MAEQRKLAAILAADVVGFSRMTSVDEDRTLARLRRALRVELIDPTVAARNGRVFKRTGDGAIIEFRSVVAAVNCARDIQSAMVERYAGLPEEHQGDVCCAPSETLSGANQPGLQAAKSSNPRSVTM
jgi:adenylate cyclase